MEINLHRFISQKGHRKIQKTRNQENNNLTIKQLNNLTIDERYYDETS